MAVQCAAALGRASEPAANPSGRTRKTGWHLPGDFSVGGGQKSPHVILSAFQRSPPCGASSITPCMTTNVIQPFKRALGVTATLAAAMAIVLATSMPAAAIFNGQPADKVL